MVDSLFLLGGLLTVFSFNGTATRTIGNVLKITALRTLNLFTMYSKPF